MVGEAMAEDPDLSMNQVVHRIGGRVGVVPDTLRGWVKQARIDAGESPGTTTGDAARIKALETENRELKRINEILMAAEEGAEQAPSTRPRVVDGMESGADREQTAHRLPR